MQILLVMDLVNIMKFLPYVESFLSSGCESRWAQVQVVPVLYNNYYYKM